MDWERIARAHAHPLRIRLMERFDASPAPLSAVMLARELGEPLGRTAHHVRQLERLGLIELESRAQRRGAIEHFYRVPRSAK